MTLLAALAALESIHEHNRSSCWKLMAPGITRSELESQLSPLNLVPSQEVCDWFGWHDGTSTDGRTGGIDSLIAGAELRPISEHLEKAQALRSVVADLTRPSDPATPVRVRWTHDWDSEDYPSWPSISAFVDWIIARFEDGTYGFDDQGFVTGPWLETAD